MHLLDIPEDILLSIITFVSVPDLLSLSQTCRALHAFVATDYIWHNTKELLPLDVTGEIVDVHAFSGRQLQQSFVRALRLERNWRRASPAVKAMHRILHEDIVFQIQFLGSELLVTLARSPTTVYVSLWNIQEFPSRQIACFDAFNASAFSSSLREDGQEVILVILTRSASLTVYSISLEASSNQNTPPKLLNRISRPKSEGTPYEVHASGHLVAAAIARFDTTLTPTHRILLLEVDTGRQLTLDPCLPEGFNQLHFSLSPSHLVIAGEVGNKLFVQCHDIRHVTTRETKSNDSTEIKLRNPVESYETFEIPNTFDYSLSTEFCDKHPNVTIMTFHSLHDDTPGTVYVFSFRPSGSPDQAVTVHTYTTPPSAVADIVCVGKTGRRAIWLERRWDTDAFTIMKATFSELKAEVGGLLRSQLALPFEMYACQSMALDEATGRVCLGLHTGEVYLLEF